MIHMSRIVKPGLWTLWGLLLFPIWVQAGEPPLRGLSAAFNHPGLIIGSEEAVDLPISLHNSGSSDDSFLVDIVEQPEGWEAEIHSFSAVVTGLFLPGGERSGLTLRARPVGGQAIEPGSYLFKIRVSSLDGLLSRESQCLVTVREKAAESRALNLSCTHPELRGPSDASFSFSVDLKNQGGDDGLVGLSAEAPEGWEVYFKPSFEEKQISSIQIPRGQSRALALDVRPGYKAGAGRYALKVLAESKWGRAELPLSVELSGTYQLRIFPANELLSASTEPGRPVALTFFVLNEGSAPQREVRFVTVAPDNWKVDFEPEALRGLEPGRGPVAVTMTVTPPEGALVGDYGLGLAAEGEKSKSALDLRFTIRAKALWAWVGLGLIVLTVLGLAFIFRRLGRR